MRGNSVEPLSMGMYDSGCFDGHKVAVHPSDESKQPAISAGCSGGEGGRGLNTYNGVEFILPMPLPELLISLENKPDQSL